MSNNPFLHYKPGLTMDTPIDVTMAAADWAVFMAWFSNLDENLTDGVKHLLYGVMGDQLTAALYTAASIQGAKAHYYESQTQQAAQIPGMLVFGAPPGYNAEDAETQRCEACGRIVGMPTTACLLCPDYRT